MEKIQKSLDLLKPQVKDKAICLQTVLRMCGVEIEPFETLRTSTRQEELYAIGRTTQLGREPITRTKQSKHLVGEAIDWVFLVTRWKGDWQKVWRVANHCGFVPVKNKKGQVMERGHTEHDGKSIFQVMETNQRKYNETTDSKLQYVLHAVNETFRSMGYK